MLVWQEPIEAGTFCSRLIRSRSGASVTVTVNPALRMCCAHNSQQPHPTCLKTRTSFAGAAGGVFARLD